MHVFKAGEHKSVAEPFLRDDMSAPEKAITERWLQVLWGQYAAAVEAQRDLAPGTINDYVNEYADRLAAAGGDSAALAQQAGLVDEVYNRDQSNDYLVATVGASDAEGRYEAMPFERYVRRQRPSALLPVEGERVAVITAQGDILPGSNRPVPSAASPWRRSCKPRPRPMAWRPSCCGSIAAAVACSPPR